MTPAAAGADSAANPYRSLLATSNATLAHMARNAPLAETLACIVAGVEEQHPGMRGAFFVLGEGGLLHLCAAPGLPAGYRDAVGAAAVEAGAWARQLATVVVDADASSFWHVFSVLALEYGLHACMALPICNAARSVLGVFVAYVREAGPASDALRQAMRDVTALAAIAIERDGAEARVKRAESTLRESRTRMSLAIEGSGTGIWDRNVATGEIRYSAGWKAILGYTEAEIVNRIEESYLRVHPDDLAYVQAAIRAHFEQKTESYAVEHRIRCKDGSYKWISSRGKVVSRDAQGQPLRMMGTTTDITTMRALSERLQQSVDLITSLTNEVPGLVYQYRLAPGGEEFFSYVSEGVGDIYELAPEQLAANAALLEDIIHPDDLAGYRASLEASAAGLTPWHLEYRVVLPRQGLRWRDGSARPRRLQDGSTEWHGLITDVTERKRMEIELQGFATIDFLTQLPNRRYFMARMEAELARVQRMAGTRTAVLMCDLDHFKTINDRYGHAIGDLVLRHFAAVLRTALRNDDMVGRVGGEEFAVVLSDAGIAEAHIFAQRVRWQIAETPLLAGDDAIAVTVSIGIAVMHATDMNVDAALCRSDMALYRAKENGRNRIEIADAH